jgi:hypothetical protein
MGAPTQIASQTPVKPAETLVLERCAIERLKARGYDARIDAAGVIRVDDRRYDSWGLFDLAGFRGRLDLMGTGAAGAQTVGHGGTPEERAMRTIRQRGIEVLRYDHDIFVVEGQITNSWGLFRRAGMQCSNDLYAEHPEFRSIDTVSAGQYLWNHFGIRTVQRHVFYFVGDQKLLAPGLMNLAIDYWAEATGRQRPMFQITVSGMILRSARVGSRVASYQRRAANG